MKKLLIVIFYFSKSLSTWGQFVDDFSDGDFTNNPTWRGDIAQFQIDNGVLRSKGLSKSDIVSLSTPSTAISKATWEFYVRLDFKPSSSNKVKIYLTSDQKDLEGGLNGYFIEIGGSGDDPIKLIRQRGQSLKTLFTSKTKFKNFVKAIIKVVRDEKGNWSIWSDPTGGNNFVSEGQSIFDNSIGSSSFFGVVCKHSSTRKDLFFFDDFKVSVAPDTSPPRLVSINAINSNSLSLRFDEKIDKKIAETASNYSINRNIGTPTTAKISTDMTSVLLTLASNFSNRITYQLTVKTAKDLHGNVSNNITQDFEYKIIETPHYQDIVINEIMADPSPPVGLPNAEFVELYNVSDKKHIDLQGYTLNGKKITDDSFILPPHSYVTLTSASNVDDFVKYGKVIGMKSFDPLSNSGETITLSSSQKTIIDQVTYASSWYKSSSKNDGGWTLERIDPNNRCSDARNWTASTDPKGGTPSQKNTVMASKPDITPPVILSVMGIAPDTLLLITDEVVTNHSAKKARYSILPNVGIATVLHTKGNREIKLVLSPALKPQVKYTLTTDGLSDQCGNAVATPVKTVFGLVEKPKKGDILINELLYNPISKDADFVEIINNSTKYIDLKGWQLANQKENQPDNYQSITTRHLIIEPNQHLAFTKEKSALESDYPKAEFSNIINVDQLPSYPNDKQTVYLLQPNDSIHDTFAYTDKHHNSLLDNTKGISLERISLTSPTADQSNWHSAATTVSATPGYLNSQSLILPNNISDQITISPEVFLPDNSGISDFSTIRYQFDQSGYVANVRIIDLQGRTAKVIADNELIGTKGFFKWDGTTQTGGKANAGVYIVLFQVFDLDGGKKIVKKRVVVAPKL